MYESRRPTAACTDLSSVESPSPWTPGAHAADHCAALARTHAVSTPPLVSAAAPVHVPHGSARQHILVSVVCEWTDNVHVLHSCSHERLHA